MEEPTMPGSSTQLRVTDTERQARRAAGILTPRDLEDEPPISWLVEGYLTEQSFNQLSGPSKSWKTFMALDWALRLAHEQDLSVLYVAAEGGRRLAPRVKAWLRTNGHRDQPSENFMLAPLAPDLLNEGQVSHLARALPRLAHDWGLIVVDTMARSMSGDENSTEDMSRFIRNMDRIRGGVANTTALVVHHFGWAFGRQRGNSAFYNGCDAVMYMKPTNQKVNQEGDDELEPETPPDPFAARVVRLTVDKQKDSPEIEDRFFKLQAVPEEESAVLIEVSEDEARRETVLPTFDCPICQEVVIPRQRTQKTCGRDRCQKALQRQRGQGVDRGLNATS